MNLASPETWLRSFFNPSKVAWQPPAFHLSACVHTGEDYQLLAFPILLVSCDPRPSTSTANLTAISLC